MVSLWEYRGLIKKIAVTDLKIRYKNSVLGFFWSLLQPMAMMVVLYIVFTNVFKNTQIESYPLYLMIGIVSWGFFDKATTFSLNSIVGKAPLVKKIYFPREVLVLSACLTALLMSLIEYLVVAIFMLYFIIFPVSQTTIHITAQILLFPVVLLLEFLMAIGVSLVIASMNVRYRDIQWIWAVIMQVGFFLTPIMYSLSMFDDSGYAELIKLNPIGVLMDMTRDVLIYGNMPTWYSLAYAAAISIGLVIFGWLVFKRFEPTFAEEV